MFDLAKHGVDIVGHIDGGLPSFGIPSGLAPSDYGKVVGSAVGIMLVGFAEGLGAAKTYAVRGHYDIDANRELIALGAANVGAGLSAGMVVSGSLSKTAVNGSAGARSQLSGVFVAVLTVVTLLFLTGLFEDLPEATLAAVVIAALIELVDYQALIRLWRLYTSELGRIYGLATRVDFIAAMSAMLGVLVFDTLPGLFIGIAVSVLTLLFRASRPHVAVLGKASDGNYWVDLVRHPDARQEPGVLVVRPESGLFFANADGVRHDILGRLHDDTRGVVLDAQSIPAIDVSAADMLGQLSTELAGRDVRLLVARDVGQVRDMLSRADDHQPGGRDSPDRRRSRRVTSAHASHSPRTSTPRLSTEPSGAARIGLLWSLGFRQHLDLGPLELAFTQHALVPQHC